MFSKMDYSPDYNNFTINKKKKFKRYKRAFLKGTVEKCFEFAYSMTFENQGEHRNYRSGGLKHRTLREIFIDAFQGKLAECGFFNILCDNKIRTNMPDFTLMPLGKWDIEDFNVYGNSISIKSTGSYGNLLLLEKKDYDENAVYIPNSKAYDFTFLVRISPCCGKLVPSDKEFRAGNVSKEELRENLISKEWEFDVPGFITREDFVEIISLNQIITQKSTLNKYTKMDADNYYVQAGDLRPFSDFTDKLKQPV